MGHFHKVGWPTATMSRSQGDAPAGRGGPEQAQLMPQTASAGKQDAAKANASVAGNTQTGATTNSTSDLGVSS